jgi:hypothetical protein
LIDIKQGGN